MNKLFAVIVLAFFSVLVRAEPLDINSATAEQIAATMNGVGKAKAEAIVKDRDVNGKFKSVDDLKRVKGVKEGILAKNRDKITVSGGAAAPAAPAAAPPAAAPAKSTPTAPAKSTPTAPAKSTPTAPAKSTPTAPAKSTPTAPVAAPTH